MRHVTQISKNNKSREEAGETVYKRRYYAVPETQMIVLCSGNYPYPTCSSCCEKCYNWRKTNEPQILLLQSRRFAQLHQPTLVFPLVWRVPASNSRISLLQPLGA